MISTESSTPTPIRNSADSCGGLDTVVSRLRQTFAGGRTVTEKWRRSQLDALRRLLAENEDAITAAVVTDLRRSAHDVWLADIAAIELEVKTARRHLRKWMADSPVKLPASQWPATGRIRPEPLGVVMIIGPWNYPFYLTLGPLVGAIAAGNCAVIKPSEYAPACGRLLAQLVPQYLDPDAFAVVIGGVEESAAVIKQRVDHILFTGSAPVGRRIMSAAAPHLTPVTLELGGKSPVVVADDANIAVAARRIAWAKLMNSGQTCITPDYILVTRPIAESFITTLTSTVAKFRPGPNRAMPLVDERQFSRLTTLLADHGGKVATGGSADTDTLSIEPTVIVDPRTDSAVMNEEIFGPILPVLVIDDVDAAVNFINQREKPLALYVFSESAAVADAVVNHTSSGGAVINHIGLHCMAPNMPFGGVGESGMGSYHGRSGFETFSHRKPVIKARTRPDLPLLYPPSTALKRRITRLFF